MEQGPSPQPLAAFRGRVIEEPTLRVVFCIVLRTISQHSCSGKKPQPQPASTASERWDFSLPFGHKRKEYPVSNCFPGSQAAKVQPLSRLSAPAPLTQGSLSRHPANPIQKNRPSLFSGKPVLYIQSHTMGSGIPMVTCMRRTWLMPLFS